MKTGIELITNERLRQIDEEGWTIEHDLDYRDNTLSNAGIYYALPPEHRQLLYSLWPFGGEWFKPGDRIRELTKAGALIAAEIDRILNNER